jgi:hypothetical protein
MEDGKHKSGKRNKHDEMEREREREKADETNQTKEQTVRRTGHLEFS